MIDPEAPMWVSCVTEDVTTESILLCIGGHTGVYTTPIISAMPRWILYSGVEFQTTIPYRCEDNLDGVTWGVFTCTGMQMHTEEEVWWLFNRIGTPEPEEFPEEALVMMQQALETLSASLLHFVPDTQHTIADRVANSENILERALNSLPDGWYKNHTIFEYKNETRSDYLVERILYAERVTVLIARALVESKPECADTIQTLLQTYTEKVPSIFKEKPDVL